MRLIEKSFFYLLSQSDRDLNQRMSDPRPSVHRLHPNGEGQDSSVGKNSDL